MGNEPRQPRSEPTGEPKTSLDDVLGYYALLGLPPSASRTQIIDAFRLQTRSTVDEIARKKLEQAYHVLQDRTLRAAYDNAARGTPNTSQPRKDETDQTRHGQGAYTDKQKVKFSGFFKKEAFAGPKLFLWLNYLKRAQYLHVIVLVLFLILLCRFQPGFLDGIKLLINLGTGGVMLWIILGGSVIGYIVYLVTREQCPKCLTSSHSHIQVNSVVTNRTHKIRHEAVYNRTTDGNGTTSSNFSHTNSVPYYELTFEITMKCVSCGHQWVYQKKKQE